MTTPVKNTIRLLIACLTLGISSTGALAQPAPKDLGELSLEDLLNVRIGVASVMGDDIFHTPSTVSVLDAATLRRYNIETIAEALDLLPGISVGRTYFRGNVPTFRGVLGDQYANKVLILINGVPTWDAITGQGVFSRIAIQDVERIEALRGSASVIYGTNAYVGAVNIVLKSGNQRRIQVDSGLGDQGGDAGVNASLGGPGGASLFLSAHAGERTGAAWTFVDENKVSGQIRDYRVDRMLTLSFQSQRHTVLANVFRSGENFLGSRLTLASGAGHELAGNGVLLSYRYTRPLFARADLTAGVAYDRNELDNPRTQSDDQAADGVGYRASAFVKSSVKIGSRWHVDLGADFDFRKSVSYNYYVRNTGVVLSDNNLHDQSIYEHSLFADTTYSPVSRLSFIVGSRLTTNQLFGSNVSSRVTAVYTFRERQSLKLLWGQSYRAPSLYEVYRSSSRQRENLSLRPETSNSVEATYVASFRGVFVQATAYHAIYDAKITRVRRYPAFVSDPADTSMIYANQGEFRANGAEVEVAYNPHNVVSTFLNVGYIDGDRGDATLGSENYNFRYVPKGTVSAGVSKNVHELSATVIGHWVQSTNGWLAPVPGHTSFDITLGYEQRARHARLKHSLFAKDLLDRGALTPEYLRGNINALPSGLGPGFGYRLQVSF